MAEDKKSFVMYCDWLSTFEELDEAEAGRLIKHILRYVNCLHPEAPDKLTKLLFEPIKQQLKRDLKKWNEQVEVKSSNGKLGNLKRWNKDLYDLVVAKVMTIETAEIIAKDRKLSLGDTLLSQRVAKIAVNDNVNVTVNDNVIEREETLLPQSKSFINEIPIEELENYMINDFKWVEKFAREYKFTLEESKEWIGKYVDKLGLDNVKEKNKNECFGHCNNWIKGELKNGSKTIRSGKGVNKEASDFRGLTKNRKIESAL